MSRIGKKPVVLKAGVSVEIKDNVVKVKGPKGELSESYNPAISIKMEDNQVICERHSDEKEFRAMHGLYRSLINNMLIGVTEGYSRKLEIVGVGYKAEVKGKGILFSLGYSHQIFFVPPAEISFTVPTPTSILLTGINKQLIGQVAAKIRALRPPEPYKGKGIKYEGEKIIRKAGKQAGK